MNAVILEKPGLFRIAGLDPVGSPGPNEALVRVRRVGICGTDLHAFRGQQPFFTYPRILGHELGVEVLEIAANDFGLKAGDRCAVEPALYCGRCIACRRGKTNCCANLKVLGVHVDGGMREQLIVPAANLHKSEMLSFDQLALTEMLGIGMHAVERASFSPDDTLLVLGAGPIGLSVIEFARLRGLAAAVMDINEKRLAYCRDTLKIAHCLNGAGDPMAQLRDLYKGELPTVVMDCTGNPQSMMNAFRYVAPGGKLIFVGLFSGEVTFDDPSFHRNEMTLMSSRNSTGDDFRRVLRLMESGVIDVDRWVTHRIPYTGVAGQLPAWIESGVEFRKAIVEW